MYLIVSIVSNLNLVETISGEDALPLVARDEGWGVHGATIANDQAIAIRRFGQVKKCILDLEHRF